MRLASPCSSPPGRRRRGRPDLLDRDVIIEYFAEGTYRPQVTLIRGQYKLTICPGDPELLFDLESDPDELVNRAGDADICRTRGHDARRARLAL